MHSIIHFYHSGLATLNIYNWICKTCATQQQQLYYQKHGQYLIEMNLRDCDRLVVKLLLLSGAHCTHWVISRVTLIIICGYFYPWLQSIHKGKQEYNGNVHTQCRELIPEPTVSYSTWVPIQYLSTVSQHLSTVQQYLSTVKQYLSTVSIGIENKRAHMRKQVSFLVVFPSCYTLWVTCPTILNIQSYTI